MGDRCIRGRLALAGMVVLLTVTACGGSGATMPSATPAPPLVPTTATISATAATPAPTATTSPAPSAATPTTALRTATVTGTQAQTSSPTVARRTATRTPSAASGPWRPAARMTVARFAHTATVLPDGKVLIAGGITGHAPNGPALDTAELYDPATGRWQPTGRMITTRAGHTATLLPDGGVLVTGGYGRGVSGDAPALDTAELYEPATGTWRSVSPMAVARGGHIAMLLPDGVVLVAGGSRITTSRNALATAEVYNPASGDWQPTGNMADARFDAAAAALPDGTVLVAGGAGGARGGPIGSAELYDPVSGTWRPAGQMSTPRFGAEAITLGDGTVLVAGGIALLGQVNLYLKSAEVYDPSVGAWRLTGVMSVGRTNHRLVPLPDGTVLTVGGVHREGDERLALAMAEVFDPQSGAWRPGGSMAAGRFLHTATVLPDGRVLVAGGSDEATIFPTSEIYVP